MNPNCVVRVISGVSWARNSGRRRDRGDSPPVVKIGDGLSGLHVKGNGFSSDFKFGGWPGPGFGPGMPMRGGTHGRARDPRAVHRAVAA